jgi:hypothetical protein
MVNRTCTEVTEDTNHSYWLKETSSYPNLSSMLKVKLSLYRSERPLRFQEGEVPRFLDNRHMKVARLLALSTSHHYPPRNSPDAHFCQRLSRTQGHSVAGRIKSMKNSIDSIVNRNRDLPGQCAGLHLGTSFKVFKYNGNTRTDNLLNIRNPCSWPKS